MTNLKPVKVFNIAKAVYELTDKKFLPHHYREAVIFSGNGKYLMAEWEMVHQIIGKGYKENEFYFSLNELGEEFENRELDFSIMSKLPVYFIPSHEVTFSPEELLAAATDCREAYLNDFFRTDWNTKDRIYHNRKTLEKSFKEIELDLRDYLEF